MLKVLGSSFMFKVLIIIYTGECGACFILRK